MPEYTAIAAMNWSSLKNMARSPLAFRHAAAHPRADTPSLMLGRAVHCAILERGQYAARYAERPAGLDLRTAEGRAWRDAAEGREVLTVEQAATVAGCLAAVRSHVPAREALSWSDTEVVATWQVDGVACKGRLDAVSKRWLVDLKTCRDLSRIERDAAEYLYHAQLAWYRHGAVAAGLLYPDAQVYLVAVETSAPHDCAMLRLPDYVLAAGERVWRRLLAQWQECDRTELWPGRYPAVHDLELPRWADPAPEAEEDW